MTISIIPHSLFWALKRFITVLLRHTPEKKINYLTRELNPFFVKPVSICSQGRDSHNRQHCLKCVSAHVHLAFVPAVTSWYRESAGNELAILFRIEGCIPLYFRDNPWSCTNVFLLLFTGFIAFIVGLWKLLGQRVYYKHGPRKNTFIY